MTTLRWSVLALVAAVGVGACGGGRHAPSRSTTPATAEPTSVDPAVTISPRDGTVAYFGPQTLTVRAGEEVQWNNWTQDQHTVTFDDPSIESSRPMGPGGSFRARFAAAGTYTYHCSIHAAMTASIVATNT